VFTGKIFHHIGHFAPLAVVVSGSSSGAGGLASGFGGTGFGGTGFGETGFGAAGADCAGAVGAKTFE
jgi:hypothetical protein